MTPATRASFISDLQQNTDEVTKKLTKQLTKQVSKKIQDDLKLSNLMQVGGPEADPAKALLRSATSNTHSNFKIVQLLQTLELKIQDHSSQAEKETKRIHRELVQVIDQRLDHLLGVIKLSRDLQIDSVHETISKVEGVRDITTSAEDIAQTTLVEKTFATTNPQIKMMLSQMEEVKKVLQDCIRHTDYLSSELLLEVRFNDEVRERELAVDETTIMTITRQFETGQIVSRGVTKGPFGLGTSTANLILYMASPNGWNDFDGRRSWSQMMLLITGRKMDGWSGLEKETGLVSAVEVVPYRWDHRFLPQEAAKVFAGDNELVTVPFPWLNLVVWGGLTPIFKWNRVSKEITISADGVRVTCCHADCCGAVAAPQVDQSIHWFEVKILNPEIYPPMIIGWSSPDVDLQDDGDDGRGAEDPKGCTW